MRKVIYLILSFTLINLGYSQQSINNYKYVIVPNQYEFLKSEDQYKLNSLTKFLFEKENFIAYFEDDQWPEDLSKDKCLALYAKVQKHSGLLRTKLVLTLNDCRKQEVFKSDLGISREKDYQKAYHEALRNAFKSLHVFNYKYSGKIEKPKQTQTVVKVATIDETPKVKSTQSKDVKVKVELKDVKYIEDKKQTPTMVVVESFLKAESRPYGFEVKDNANNAIKFYLIKTGKENVYFVKDEHAIVYKTPQGLWKKEAIKNNTIVVETLDLRF